MFELIKLRRAKGQRADEQRFRQRVGVLGPRRKAFGDHRRERDHEGQQADTEAEVPRRAGSFCVGILRQIPGPIGE